MLYLAALIALCLHFKLGWWTALAVLCYLPITATVNTLLKAKND